VLIARDAALNDQFGQVALDGDYALIGAFSADALNASDAGAAYVFHRAAGVWSQVAKLTAPTPRAGAHFGASVALHGDIAMIGGPQGPTQPGGVHTFKRIPNGNWLHQSSVTASDAAAGDEFGSSIAFDGQTAAVGARADNTAGGTDAGSIYVGAITTGGGGLSITNNPNATTINTGALTVVSGNVDVSGNTNAGTIDLGGLTDSGDVNVSGNTNASTIDLGGLTDSGDVNVSGNTNAGTIDLSGLTDSGDVNVSGNTNAGTIDLSGLTSTGSGNRLAMGSLGIGDLTITGNTAASSLDLPSLATVGGNLTITDNPALSNVAFPALDMVEGDVTLQTRVQTSVDLAGVAIAGDLNLDSTNAASVLGKIPAGDTSLSLRNAETLMELQLPPNAFAAGTPFDIERIPPESLSTVNGMDATGNTATVDPLSASHFDFGPTPPTTDVDLDFELTVGDLSPADQAAILAAWQANHLSMTYQPNAPGSQPQALPTCGGGLLGCTPPVAAISGLNQMHQPVGQGETPAFFHCAAQVTGFSTYAVAIVTPFPRIPGDADCDGHLDGGDIDAFLLALLDPNAYGAAHPNCNIRNNDSNNDGPVNLADVAPFVNCILTGVCP
jgi:hypothetical protein